MVNINAGYSGTITLARSLTVSNTFTQSAGIFNGSNQTMVVTGIFTLNSGANFTSTSGTMTLSSSITINSSATFNANGGTITLAGTGTATWACGSKTFNSVVINRTASGVNSVTANSDCSLPLGANPTVELGAQGTFILNGTISGSGTLTIDPQATGFTLVATSVLSGFNGLISPGISSITGMTADFSGYSPFNLTGGLAMALSTGANLTLPAPTGTGINVASLTVNTGTTFTSTSGTLNITGATTINAGANFNHNNGVVTFTGTGSTTLACGNKTFNSVVINRTASGVNSFTIGGDCNFPIGANPTLNFGAQTQLIMSGTLSGTGTLTIDPDITSLAFASTTVLSGFNGFVSPGITTIAGMNADFVSYSTFNLTGGFTTTLSTGASLILPAPTGTGIILGALTVNTGTTFTSAPGNISVGGSLTISSTATFNHNNGTITFNGNAATSLACGNKTLNSVVINKSFSSNLGFTVGSDCSIPLGANPTINVGSNGTFNLNGTLSGSGTLTLDPDFSTVAFASTTVLSGFNGLVAPGITSITGMTADFSSYTTFNLTSSLGMVLSSGANLTVPAPTGTGINLASLTVNTGTTFTASPGIINMGATLSINSGATFNHNNGTLNFNGSSDFSMACGNKVLNLVTFNLASNANDVTIGADCTIPLGNNPTVAIGSVASNNLVLNGALTGSGTLTFPVATSSVTINSTGSITGFDGLSARSILVAGPSIDFGTYSPFSATGLSISSGSITLPASTSVSSVSVTGGTFNSGDSLIVSGVMTLSGGTFNAGNFTSVGGDFTRSGTNVFNANGGTLSFPGTSAILSCNNATFGLVNFTGQTQGKTVSSNCNLPLGNNPTIPQAITLSGILTGTGTLTHTTGTMSVATGADITGFTGYAGTTNALTISGATLDFSSHTNTVIGSTFTLSSGSFTAGTSGDMTVGGNLTITTGTFTAPSGTLNAGGGFLHAGGTFNHNNGTVNLNGGNQVITGTSTFYNLTKEITSANTYSLTIPITVTQTVLNTLTFKGFSTTNRLQLRSSVTNTQYRIDPQGTRDMLYIDAKDGNNVNVSSLQLAGTGSLDSGNNSNFGFTNTAPDNPTSLGPVSVVAGNSIASYTPTFTFTIRDTANPLDTLSYRFQLSTASDFSTQVIDYSSALAAQGVKSFTVGQAVGTGTYTVGSSGQSLAVGNYYWRVMATDQNAATSSYTAANSGNIAFFISGAPNNPTTLGPTAFVNGSINTTTQPTLTFNLTDQDVGDTVKYKIELASVSDFSTLLIDYTSVLQTQGAATFTVGQAAGSGTYTTGTSGQVLASGSYYWRVKNIDSSVLESGYTTANSGAVAFIINALPNVPTNLAPTNLIDGSSTTNTQPTFTFDITDADVADTVKFQIQIDDSSNFASPVVSYTSALAAQGARTFTVGQATSGGSYSNGTVGQVLGNGSYYLRIRTTDNHVLNSSYLTANGGSIAFSVNGLPNVPSNLGPTNYINGSVSVETQPTLTFDITDPDGADTVRYHIQIDDTSNFSSVVVDYTSDLQAQGSTSFTIGQPDGTGTYTTGSEGQNLSSFGYYWRVKTIDLSGNESLYTTANGGSRAFEITQTPYVPSGLGPANLVNGSTTTDTTPSLTFTISDPDVSDSVYYNIQISTVSDFSTTVIDVTSNITTQGFKSYTTSVLSSGSYYWRVRTRDENNIYSDYATANGGAVAFVVAAPPNTPTTLAPTTFVNGSVNTNTQPALTFSLSDADVADTLQYTIQISTASNFSALVVDYTSALGAQGAKSFTVGQAAGTGSYTVGTSGQTLASTNYYWRVMSTDSTGLTSSYATANSGNIAFVISQTPTDPTNLGPTNVVDGSTDSQIQPTFTFDIADPDGSDTVKFQILIDDTANFSSPVINYSSALGTSGSKSFTVGQAAGTGAYTVGTSGQTLANGSYYWRVRTTDNHNLNSGYTTANGGSIAFVIGGLPDVPSALGAAGYVNGSATLETQPTLDFNLSDSDLLDTVKYEIQISKSSSYSTLVIDYTSDLQAQGSKSFTVGQLAGSGTYSTGSESEELTPGAYYWRVKAIDQSNNESAYSSANSGAMAFRVTRLPNVPNSLGPTEYADGSLVFDSTPTLTFNATDPDSDQVLYRIQIDDNSDFSSVLVNYLSNNGSSGARSFTVGQTNGGGSYTTGNSGQILLSNSYYWRVKTIDIYGFESDYTAANSGSIAFEVTSAPNLPTSIGPASVINGTTSTSTQPSFVFTTSDAEFADLLKYQFQLSSVSNFSSLLIDYVSDLQIQDAKQFIVGQPVGSGTYYSGSQGQVLSSGSYYWRVRSIDQSDVASSYKVANNGGIAFKVTQNPQMPGGLGPTSFTEGASSTDSTPTLSFTISDPDVADLVSYQIQISDNSSFTSIVVDYLSSLQTQGFKSFTVGQLRSGGTYTRGSEGQNLAIGNFYWRVRTIDQGGITSEYTVSNSGNVAFVLATTVTPPVVIPPVVVTPPPEPTPETPVETPTSYPSDSNTDSGSDNTDSENNTTETPNNFVSGIIENLFPASYAGIFTPLNPFFKNISDNISQIVRLDLTVDTTNVSSADKGILIVASAIVSTSVLTSPSLVLYAIPFFKKSKSKTWGLIYDTNSNKPIAFATVRLFDAHGKFLEQAISDLAGRYKFVQDKGTYTLVVLHSDYQKKYLDIALNLENEIGVDIPMNKNLSQIDANKFNFTRLQRTLRTNLSKINTVLFILGFIFSIISVLNNAGLFNVIILAIFLVQMHRIFNDQIINKGWGFAYDILTRKPVSGLIVRVYEDNASTLKDTILTDSKGRFKFNLPKGNYDLMIVSDKYKLSDIFKSNHKVESTKSGQELVEVNTNTDYKIDLKLGLISNKA